jgi:hypothetical protein
MVYDASMGFGTVTAWHADVKQWSVTFSQGGNSNTVRVNAEQLTAMSDAYPHGAEEESNGSSEHRSRHAMTKTCSQRVTTLSSDTVKQNDRRSIFF